MLKPTIENANEMALYLENEYIKELKSRGMEFDNKAKRYLVRAFDENFANSYFDLYGAVSDYRINTINRRGNPYEYSFYLSEYDIRDVDMYMKGKKEFFIMRIKEMFTDKFKEVFEW